MGKMPERRSNLPTRFLVMAKSSSKRGSSARTERKLSKGGAINRASIRGTAGGGNRKLKTPNERRTSSTRRSGSGRRGHEDSPTRGLDPARRSTRPNRQVFGTVDSAQRDTDPANDGASRARGWMGETGERFAQGRGAASRAHSSHRKSGANGGSRFEYDERDSTDSAEPTGWSGMDEERQKRPASRAEREDRSTPARRIDNDHEEFSSPARPDQRRSRSGSARADAGDHATPARGESASTEGHVTGAAARGRRGNGGVGAATGRGRAGRPRSDW